MEQIVDGIVLLGRRNLQISNISLTAKLGVSSPQEDTANRIVINDRIEQIQNLGLLPNKITLEFRQEDIAAQDSTSKLLNAVNCRFGGARCDNDFWGAIHRSSCLFAYVSTSARIMR